MESENNSPDAPVHAVVHTPGPWESTDSLRGNGRFKVIQESSGQSLTGWGCVTQTEPNAKLMAAAPDLLAACRDMIEAMNDYECSVDDPPTRKHREMMLRAMSAVEKATGRVNDKDNRADERASK